MQRGNATHLYNKSQNRRIFNQLASLQASPSTSFKHSQHKPQHKMVSSSPVIVMAVMLVGIAVVYGVAIDRREAKKESATISSCSPPLCKREDVEKREAEEREAKERAAAEKRAEEESATISSCSPPLCKREDVKKREAEEREAEERAVAEKKESATISSCSPPLC